MISNSNKEATSSFKILEDMFIEAINKIKASANDSIESGKQILNDELGKVFENAISTMSSVKDLGEKPIQIMESAWETMTSIDVVNALM